MIIYRLCSSEPITKGYEKMSIKAVLFDLDGTLLPMDLDQFIKGYFSSLTKGMASRGFDAKKFSRALLAGVDAMMKNNGRDTNENLFWQTFEAVYGEDARSREALFNDFYNNEFQSLSSLCGVIEDASWAVRTIRNMGYRTVLATNPVFPPIATESRMRWAGLEPSDFEFYTTYENSSYAKPKPEYYLEIAKRLGLDPSECLMVGNDTTDDMVAESVGMSVYLLPEYLINKSGADISVYNYGNLKNLVAFIENLKLRTEN